MFYACFGDLVDYKYLTHFPLFLTVLYYCYKDSRIRKVKGLEVGTGKVRLNIFTVDQ